MPTKKPTKTAKTKKLVAKRIAYKDRIDERMKIKKDNLIKSTIFLYAKLEENQKDKIKERYTKKLERRLKKIEKQYEIKKNRQIKKKVYKKELKELEPTKGKRKQMAFTEIQLYARISRANPNGMVLQIDTDKMVHYTKCVGGHLRPKHNYPQLACDIRNIRPISSYGNKRQLDQIGYERMKNVPLPASELEYLERIADDIGLKNKIRDTNYYKEIYYEYKKKNDYILKYIKSNDK